MNLDAPAVSHYKQADVDPPTALCGASLIGVLAPVGCPRCQDCIRILEERLEAWRRHVSLNN